MLETDEIYIVVDIEADGPVPGPYSMLSIGAVAVSDKETLGDFYRTLRPLGGARQHPATMEWWKTQPDAWSEVTQNTQPAKAVMRDFAAWVESFGCKAIFVSHPVGYDYAFVNWYLHAFADTHPFINATGASRTLDIQSFIAGKYGWNLRQSSRSQLPPSFLEGAPAHTHKAIDDARVVATILLHALGER